MAVAAVSTAVAAVSTVVAAVSTAVVGSMAVAGSIAVAEVSRAVVGSMAAAEVSTAADSTDLAGFTGMDFPVAGFMGCIRPTAPPNTANLLPPRLGTTAPIRRATTPM